jgi:hypothetical protein
MDAIRANGQQLGMNQGFMANAAKTEFSSVNSHMDSVNTQNTVQLMASIPLSEMASIRWET